MSADGFAPDLSADREVQLAEVRRAAVRSDLYYFTRYMFQARRNFRWLRSPHHQIICDALMKVFLGQTKRLIINVPPRYSKSEIAVVNFIAFCLGNFPDAEFITTSYSGRLAANNSWAAKDLVNTTAYREAFPEVVLRNDSQAKDEWRTTAGGIVYATGAGGTITGYGAGKERPGFGGAIIIDDPHKADEARSDVIREGVIEWFQNTLESRKNSAQTPIILIMQRLHERDLAGWLLAGGNGEEWERVILPAIQPDGTALWEAKHDLAELMRMRDAAPMTFAGQYMQSPSPAEGNIFKPDQIKVVDAVEVEPGIQWVRGWDFAGTAPAVGKDPDWTAAPKLGIYPDGRVIIADLVHMRGSPDEVERALVNTASGDGRGVKVSIPQDPGQAGKFQAQYFTKKLQGYRVHTSPESGDKVTRAEPLASQVNVGNVSMVRAEWNDRLKAEMRLFPNGAHDDIVDGLSRAYSVVGAKAPAMNINRDAVRQTAMAASPMRAGGMRR